MKFKRRKPSRNKWIFGAVASLLAGMSVWIGRKVMRRRNIGKIRRPPSRPPSRPHSRPMPPQAYGLEESPGFEPAQMGLPLDVSETSDPVQVPVTAQRTAKKPPAAPRRGTARAYDLPDSRRERVGEVEKRPFPWLLAIIPLVILAVITGMSLLNRLPARAQVVTVPGGDIEAGRQAIQAWGCGSCHTIPGIQGAYGKVGPKLDQLAEQTYIAGMLPNTPDNLMQWIMHPQEIQPGNAMPDTGVGLETARNMAAYLYSIRD